MNTETIGRILTAYGYRDFTLLPVEKGYRNESHPFVTLDGQTRNLILYKRESGILETIRNADRTADFAARSGLPVRQTVGSRVVRLQTGSWQKYGRVYTYLLGHTIPWEAYTHNHIKLLGKSMGDLHTSLQSLQPYGYPSVADQYIAITRRMETYFLSPSVQEAMRRKLGVRVTAVRLPKFIRLLEGTKRLEHQQILHMDFVRSNILFDDGEPIEISGILDFEKTALGHPIFDIARTLAFLLVDCKYKSERQVRKYFLDSGYRRRGAQAYHPVVVKNSDENIDLLEVLLELFLLYDLYKFLLHNPYEALPDNEHFMRTKTFLHTRGLVEVI